MSVCVCACVCVCVRLEGGLRKEIETHSKTQLCDRKNHELERERERKRERERERD